MNTKPLQIRIKGSSFNVNNEEKKGNEEPYNEERYDS